MAVPAVPAVLVVVLVTAKVDRATAVPVDLVANAARAAPVALASVPVVRAGPVGRVTIRSRR